MPETPSAAPSSDAPLLVMAARGCCPACGAATLFSGPVQFASRCPSCGLDFGQFNVGDGPAAFLTLILGAVILALALIVEFRFHPPVWLHMLLWIPLTIASVVAALRVAKGALLILEYRNKAREGRIAIPGIEP